MSGAAGFNTAAVVEIQKVGGMGLARQAQGARRRRCTATLALRSIACVTQPFLCPLRRPEAGPLYFHHGLGSCSAFLPEYEID